MRFGTSQGLGDSVCADAIIIALSSMVDSILDLQGIRIHLPYCANVHAFNEWQTPVSKFFECEIETQ